MSNRVNLDGEDPSPMVPGPLLQAARSQLETTTAQLNALTNIVTALVRRDGGQTIVRLKEIEDIENCVLTSTMDVESGGIRLSVRRDAPRAAS